MDLAVFLSYYSYTQALSLDEPIISIKNKNHVLINVYPSTKRHYAKAFQVKYRPYIQCLEQSHYGIECHIATVFYLAYLSLLHTNQFAQLFLGQMASLADSLANQELIHLRIEFLALTVSFGPNTLSRASFFDFFPVSTSTP